MKKRYKVTVPFQTVPVISESIRAIRVHGDHFSPPPQWWAPGSRRVPPLHSCLEAFLPGTSC